MIFLLREHSHSNDVATYYDNNKDYFYKVSHTEHGNYLINNEIKGFAFFNKLKLSEKIYFKQLKKGQDRYGKIGPIQTARPCRDDD